MTPRSLRASALSRSFLRLPPEGLKRLRAGVEQAARESRLVYLDDDGTTRVLDVKLRPRVVTKDQERYLTRVAHAAIEAQRAVARAYFREPALRSVLALEPAEERVLARLDARQVLAGPILGRVDTNAPLDAPTWRRDLGIFEVNGVGVGGIDYAFSTETLIESLVCPRVRLPARLRRGPDLPRRLLRSLLAHGRRLGAAQPVIALVEERTPGGTFELERFREKFEALGARVIVVDPREIDSRPRGLYAEGRRIDVVYRDIELRDLLSLGTEAELAGALRAFDEGRVLSSPCADFDHKSLLEVFTDTRWASLLSPGLRKSLRPHALWTRLLYERRTTDWAGRPINLLATARRQRRALVLKPDRAFGGKGVVIGPYVSQRHWEHAIETAAAKPRAYVVQRFAEVPREPFPARDGDRARLVRQHTDLGLFVLGPGVGYLSRAAPSPIVNIASGGGIAAVLRAT